MNKKFKFEEDIWITFQWTNPQNGLFYDCIGYNVFDVTVQKEVTFFIGKLIENNKLIDIKILDDFWGQVGESDVADPALNVLDIDSVAVDCVGGKIIHH